MKRKYLFISIFAILILSIGGVYSYFSAVGNNTGDAITGQTNDIGELNIVVARVNLNPNPTPSSDDLVPAEFGVTPDNMTTTLVNNALNAKCVNNGYTGCHVWRITATSTQTIPSANIKLSFTLPNVIDKDEWSYIVYTGTDATSSNISYKGRINQTFPTASKTLDIHNGGGLTANTPQVYYVMVYLNNTNSAQNDGVTTGTTDARGRYNGTVSLEAMNGTVKASFYEPEPEPTDASFFSYTIENNEVTITGYHNAVSYTVTDQSACENYNVNMGASSEQATTICTGGSVEGMTLGDVIAEGFIPSSDYASAGLSNVVITPAPTDVIIPSTMEGYPVVSIRGKIEYSNGGFLPGAFDRKGVTSVVIPSSVTLIEKEAFDGNPLTSITIGNENVIMDNCAFGENPPLSEPFASNYLCRGGGEMCLDCGG